MRLPPIPSWAPWSALGAALAAALFYAVKPPGGGGPVWEGPSPTPADPFNGKPVDSYAPQQTNHPGACDPVAKEGVKLFRQWVISKWGERAKSPTNIVRACDKGSSEHEQGRAWDQMVTNQDQGQATIDALLAPDPITGEPHALARRAGVMYLIWAGKMWRSYPHAGNPSGSWEPYSGGESGSMHFDHVHYSFSHDGADGLTSLYDMIRATMPVA